MDVLGFSQFKTAYQKLANSLASECGGQLTRGDFLKAIEVPYKQAFSQENICKAFEITGTWPVNRNSITPDQTAPSIGLSSSGGATISPTSPVKAINTLLLQLPALLPSLASPPDSSNQTPPTSDLQDAMADLCKTLQDTHVSFLFDDSAASSANEVKSLQFPPLSKIPIPDPSENDGDSIPFDKMTKSELCAMIVSLKEEMKQAKELSRSLIQDRTTLISQLSLVHMENRKLRSGLFKREKKRQTARERISPGGKGISATSDECLTMISAIDKKKSGAGARKGGSQGIPNITPEEKDRRRNIWKIAIAEYAERKAQLKSNGVSAKFAGGKPLLRWFIEANDPEALLEDLQNPNGAFSPPAPRQTRRQCHETVIYEEDDGEWSDENGQRND